MKTSSRPKKKMMNALHGTGTGGREEVAHRVQGFGDEESYGKANPCYWRREEQRQGNNARPCSNWWEEANIGSSSIFHNRDDRLHLASWGVQRLLRLERVQCGRKSEKTLPNDPRSNGRRGWEQAMLPLWDEDEEPVPGHESHGWYSAWRDERRAKVEGQGAPRGRSGPLGGFPTHLPPASSSNIRPITSSQTEYQRQQPDF